MQIMGNYGRQSLVSKYSFSVMEQKIVAMYENVIALAEKKG